MGYPGCWLFADEALQGSRGFPFSFIVVPALTLVELSATILLSTALPIAPWSFGILLMKIASRSWNFHIELGYRK